MHGLLWPDWAGVFVPDASLAESFLRGSAVYLTLVVLFRLVLKRQGGSIGVPDVMLVVLVSECVSSALTANARSVPNGIVTVVSLLFWNYVLDWLAYRFPFARRVLEPEPLELIRDGRIVRENLTREQISHDELAAQLREQGIDEVALVKSAYLESEGSVSVIPFDGERRGDVSGKPTREAGLSGDPASPETKMAALRRHFIDAIPAPEVCREFGITADQFRHWQSTLFRNGGKAF
jgi:uncharacterized membrane protein YcaP (DUF421 family)